ncbi:MAG: hypothetical protein ACFBWO_08440 [Paracoccaceae bacterium]
MRSLEGGAVLVTGRADGIGAATRRRLAGKCRSSIYGVVDAADFRPRRASKGAVRETTEVDASCHAEAKDDSRTGPVHPGFVRTPLGEESTGRSGAPEEIASAVAFLVSSDAAFVAGSGPVIGGGCVHR